MRFSWNDARTSLGITMPALVAAAALAVTGCGPGATAATPSDPYVGSWSGAVADDRSGPGSIRITFPGALDLEGRWEALASGATVGGTVSRLPSIPGDSRRHFGLRCGPGLAGGSALLSIMLNGPGITGTYAAAGCGSLTGGRVELAREARP